MLKLFQSSNPFTLLFFALYSVALQLHLFFNPQEFSATGHAISYNLFFIQLLHAHQLPAQLIVCIHIIIVSLQGILITLLTQNNKIIQKASLVPAAVFVLIVNIFPDIPLLSPEIIAALLLTWALFKIFITYNKTKVDSALFDIGLITAVASLFFYPAVIFILYSIIAVIRLRATSFREFLVLISGAVVIYFLAATAFFWFDRLNDAKEQFYFPLTIPETGLLFTTMHVVKFSLIGIVLIISLWFLSEKFSSNIVQIRKYLGSFITLFIFSAGIMIFSKQITISNCYFLFIPATVIISYYFMQTKKYVYAELMYLGLLIAAIIFQTINFA